VQHSALNVDDCEYATAAAMPDGAAAGCSAEAAPLQSHKLQSANAMPSHASDSSTDVRAAAGAAIRGGALDLDPAAGAAAEPAQPEAQMKR
jgi:hypothetical protein